MSELLKEWEVSCALRQGWLVQSCRERGKDECRKHDLLEQNEYGDPLLTQGIAALPLGALHGRPDFTGWLVVFAGAAVLSSHPWLW